MTRNSMWAAMGVLGLASVATVTALADFKGDGSSTEVRHAKRIVELIEQGQLNLRDASQVAERHVNGTALQTTCTIQPVDPAAGSNRGQQPKPTDQDMDKGSTAERHQSGGEQLVYEVACFADERVQNVRVNGLTKKVMDSQAQR